MAFILLLIVLALYFVPTFVAGNRQHANVSAIFFLNLLLGWTLIGWVGALVWALSNQTTPTVVINQPIGANAVRSETVEATKTCPRCAEQVKPAALVCRFCGYDFAVTSAQT